MCLVDLPVIAFAVQKLLRKWTTHDRVCIYKGRWTCAEFCKQEPAAFFTSHDNQLVTKTNHSECGPLHVVFLFWYIKSQLRCYTCFIDNTTADQTRVEILNYYTSQLWDERLKETTDASGKRGGLFSQITHVVDVYQPHESTDYSALNMLKYILE